jgi:hypothetical protein
MEWFIDTLIWLGKAVAVAAGLVVGFFALKWRRKT